MSDNRPSNERAAFEAYILRDRGQDYLQRSDDGVHDYSDHFVQEAWEAWQARASAPPSTSLPEYTTEIGEAGDKYLSSKSSSGYWNLPATFLWQELWDAMRGAAVTKPAPEDPYCRKCGGPHWVGQCALVLAGETNERLCDCPTAECLMQKGRRCKDDK